MKLFTKKRNLKFNQPVHVLLCILLRSLFTLCDSTAEDPGTPLMLTPLIKAGKIQEARNQSEVKPFTNTSNISSNSGFLTVNSSTDSHLFFWFFQKHGDDYVNSPLILRLVGGPGSSAIASVFRNNGPYKITKKGFEKARFPLTKNYNVLYIDNPVGTGFSTTSNTSLVTTEEEIGEHLYIALIQFFNLFPELQKNEFFIFGDSYAGKFTAAIAYKIYKSNSISNFKINLKGLFIGNGLAEPESMMNRAEYLHRLGLIDMRMKVHIQNVEEDVRILIRNGLFEKALETWREKVFGLGTKVTEFSIWFDYIHENVSHDISYEKFVKDPRTREAIHVGSTSFSHFSSKVNSALKSDSYRSVRFWIEELVEVYRIMYYSGQTDIILAHTLTSNFLQELHWSGAQNFKEAERKKLYVGGRLAGYYTSAGNLKQALIRDAEHVVSISKPKVLLNLFDKFVQDEF